MPQTVDDAVALNLRKFPAVARASAREHANARGLTLGAYFVALIELHEAMIREAHAGRAEGDHAVALLRESGLAPVTL